VPAPAVKFREAEPGDIAALVELRTAVAAELTRIHGKGPWSSATTPAGVLRGLKGGRVLIAHRRGEPLGTLSLATKKPWAIDPEYFQPVSRPLYLHSMSIAVERQNQGLGRRLVEEAKKLARIWPAQSIRLDAYDAPAGAGGFYAKCGFREVGRVTYRGTPLIYFEYMIEGGTGR